MNLLLAALKILHPRPNVWTTPTDEQAKEIEHAIAVAISKQQYTSIAEAVSFAATLLSRLKRQSLLDERDRKACADIQHLLVEVENVMYAIPPNTKGP